MQTRQQRYGLRWTVAMISACGLLCMSVYARAQAAPVKVDIAKANLSWTWTQGTGGPVEKWIVRCGSSSGNYSQLTEWPSPNARSVLVSQIAPTIGTYFCVVQAANSFGAGGASPEVSFQAGAAPSAVITLEVKAQ